MSLLASMDEKKKTHDITLSRRTERRVDPRCGSRLKEGACCCCSDMEDCMLEGQSMSQDQSLQLHTVLVHGGKEAPRDFLDLDPGAPHIWEH